MAALIPASSQEAMEHSMGEREGEGGREKRNKE
jgi:hypothetical protein